MNVQVIKRATIALIVAVAVCTTIVSGQESKAEGDKVSFLFVQMSTSGSLSRISEGHYKLIMNDVSPHTISFSDHPVRQSGLRLTYEFVQNWSSGPDGFAQNPPNAVLEVILPDLRPVAAVVVLSKPVYTAKQNKLTYDVKVIGESKSKFHQIHGDVKTMPGHFKTTSLFIDAGCSPWDPRC
jgi:outer membrane murein-binding lipoprotein Lpp